MVSECFIISNPKILTIALVVFLISGCGHLFYHPTRSHYIDLSKSDVVPKDVWFNSLDGTQLHGWYFSKTQKPKGVIVFFHGNAGNISTHFAALTWILVRGWDFFIFDYRGFGKSHGEPFQRGTVEDGIAALNWIHNSAPQLAKVVFGQSLGGAIALRSVAEAKSEIPISLLIVESTFPSYQEVGRSTLARHWFTWPIQWLAYLLISDYYAPESVIAGLSPIPLVVIHGDNDDKVDFELGQSVFDLAKEPKEFWRVQGGGHIRSLWGTHSPFRKRLLNKLEDSVR